MPGLFGAVSTDLARYPLDRDKATAILGRISKALYPHPDFSCETHFDQERGFAVGRIGHARSSKCSWPAFGTGTSDRLEIYATGVLHNRPVISGSKFDDTAESYAAFFLQLRGFYAALCSNKVTQSIAITVDRSASRPIYYTEIDGLVVFAPEVQGLIGLPAFERRVNIQAAGTFLACGFLLDDQTLFQGIRRLEGGYSLIIAPSSKKLIRYWRTEPGSLHSGESERDLSEELQRLILNAVGRNFDQGEETAVLLSGGVDSRGILSACLSTAGGDGAAINSVTWGVDEGEGNNSDVEVARRIARNFKLNHTFCRRDLDAYTDRFNATNRIIEGMSIVPAFQAHQDRVFQDIRDLGFRAVLRGDECFGWNRAVFELPSAIYESAIRRFRDVKLLKDIVRKDQWKTFSDYNDATFDGLLNKYADLPTNEAKDRIYFEQRLQHLLQSSSYWRQVYFDERNVLLDDDILDFMKRVPTKLRSEKVLFKKVVAEMHPELWKEGFATPRAPENWRRELSDDRVVGRFLRNQLDDRKSGVWEFVDSEAVRRVLDQYTSSKINRRSTKQRIRRQIEDVAYSIAPRQAMRAKDDLRKSFVSPEQAVMRVLVLKDWHDTYMT